MRYRISHTTGYTYSAPASLSQNELLLRPRATCYQHVVRSQLKIAPDPQYLHHRTDYFGNTVDVFMVQHPHDNLSISASSVVDTTTPALPVFAETSPWEEVARRLAVRGREEDLEACQFVFASPLIAVDSATRAYAEPSFGSGTPVLAGAADLILRIFKEFTYDTKASNVDTTVDQVLHNRKGVCQDFAHLAISCLRSLGLAARYVSGYLETLPPPGKPKLFGSDASHAWLSLFIPDHGWVDLDPTNNMIVNASYITLAWGRDYGDVAPVKGVVMGGGTHQLSVTVDVAAEKK